MKATTTTSGAARKKVKKGTLKSPFELSQGQKKLASTSSKASVRSTKEVDRKKDKKAQLRSVQDARKEKDAKLKALSNRIAWLKAEEERASLKVGELNNLIDVAKHKKSRAISIEGGSGKLSKDVQFRSALTQGKDEAVRSKQKVRVAAKENKKNVRALPKPKTKAKKKEEPGVLVSTIDENVSARASTSKPSPSRETDERGVRVVVPAVRGAGEREGAEEVEEKVVRVSRVQAKQKELENTAHDPSKTLSALELIRQRWKGSKQPLRENMEITRKQILSHNHRNVLAKMGEKGGPQAYHGTINIFEYSAGAWRTPLV